jgi:hypothetical protein
VAIVIKYVRFGVELTLPSQLQCERLLAAHAAFRCDCSQDKAAIGFAKAKVNKVRIAVIEPPRSA